MTKLIPYVHPAHDGFEDEKRYEWQMDIRANYLILGDKNVEVPIETITNLGKILDTNLIWLHRGELIAGSFMSNLAHNADIKYNDIDIYFHSANDANEFLLANKISNASVMFRGPIAIQVMFGKQILNLIWGVAFNDAKDLISHFDIRACSVAYDPQWNLVHTVKGALWDAANKFIVFNPVPHHTTVARVIKYVQRNFNMDAYQRLFFAELIRSDMYNTDLELSTGYRPVQK
jgi:hypothetical protein